MDRTAKKQPGLVGRSGQLEEFVARNVRIEIRADFDQTGRVALDDAEPGCPPYEAARAVRDERPGAILLPALDKHVIPRDCQVPVHIRPVGEGLQEGDPLVLQFEQAPDQRRLVGYRNVGNKWQHVLGLGSDHEQITVPAPWPGEDLRMCALTLAGDPRRPGPLGRPDPPTAPPDSPYNELRPGEVWMRLQHRKGGAPPWQPDDLALFQIAPLLLQSNLAPVRRLYVVSMPHNHNAVYDIMEACWDAFGAPGEFDRDSSRRFSASTPDERRSTADTVHVVDETGAPLLSSEKMYRVNWGAYPDAWIQDQMATGYCSAPGGRGFNVVLHCKRARRLKNFVPQEMHAPRDRVLVFNGISTEETTAARDETDFGGNIMVSPPVKKATPSQPPGPAGPRVPAHPPAPHGKIILGDCYNPHREAEAGIPHAGTVHDETRTLLQSQGVQPIVPIDTSWLAVAHVDEITAVVPGADGPKLAMPSPDIMTRLLLAVTEIGVQDGRTHFHRGRHKAHCQFLHLFFNAKRLERGDTQYSDLDAAAIRRMCNLLGNPEDILVRSYDETSVETLFENQYQINECIRTQRLDPIQHRLCRCTGRSRTDILPLPVYFHVPNSTTLTDPWGKALAETRTPNVVNMQVLNTDPDPHLLVPDPCGPRLPRPAAHEVVRSVLDSIGRPKTPVHLPQTKQDGERGFQFWAWPFLKIQTVALFFTRETSEGRLLTDTERRQIISVIKREQAFSALRPVLQQAVHDTRKTLLRINDGAAALLDDEGIFTAWYRLFIPEDTVDVVAAYTQSVLARLGCTVHFVDAWFYHTGAGGVHCGTSVLHKPPSADSSATSDRSPWWENYSSLVPPDTSYNPYDTAYPSSS